jgi:hypothetical protein
MEWSIESVWENSYELCVYFLTEWSIESVWGKKKYRNSLQK